MHTLRNVMYTAMIAVWVLLATIVLGCLIIAMAFLIQKPDWFHLIARLWAKSILWVSWVKVEVKGFENLPKEGPCILMPIHQSNFDIPVLLGRLPVQFRWLAKAELFKIPIFGRGMRGCGYISIDRSNRKSAFLSLADAARKIRNGTSVLIFPEGTRSRDGEIGAFNVFTQFFDGSLGALDEINDGIADLAEVMGRDIGSHADGDAGAAVEEEVGEAGGQHGRLLEAVIEVGHEVDSLFFNIDEHFLGDFSQTGFSIAHGGGGVIIDAAEVALAIDEWIAHREVLRQTDHSIIDR